MLCSTAVVFSSFLWVASCAKGPVFVNEWAVKIAGGPRVAQRLASDFGYTNYGEILPDSGEYHLKVPHRRKRSLVMDKMSARQFASHPEVVSARQLEVTNRAKRAPPPSVRPIRNGTVPLLSSLRPAVSADVWYLTLSDASGMRVREAWDLGFSGRGTRVTVVDDGIEHDHPDLEGNFDPECSTDIVDNDRDPWPVPSLNDNNTHGTRCAGEVAARHSSNCSVGVAFNANIGGIRFIDDKFHTDAKEARALSFNRDYIDIYSNSWGPYDHGGSFGGPEPLSRQALKEGVEKGRRGKGNIFIWAAGNGGRDNDDCNADGYCTSIYTITVGSASESKRKPSFSEACSSILATTFSSGDDPDRAIVTTDVHHGCTKFHTGSSTSAPLAAGVVALAMEANPNLTWRDVQHIVVRTSRPAGLRASRWNINGAGRRFSHDFGFGLMDAVAAVRLAKHWRTVPKQEVFKVVGQRDEDQKPAEAKLEFIFKVNNSSPVALLEHVVVPLVGSFCTYRGNHKVTAFSPFGTKSTLLNLRRRDDAKSPFTSEWPLMSVHFWGENPVGTWKIKVTCYDSFHRNPTLQIPYLGLYGASFFHVEEGHEAKGNTSSSQVPNKGSSPRFAPTESYTGCVSPSLTCVSVDGGDASTNCLTTRNPDDARTFCMCVEHCSKTEVTQRIASHSAMEYKFACSAPELPTAKLPVSEVQVCSQVVGSVLAENKSE